NASPKARVENTTAARLLGSVQGATATAPGARSVTMFAHADDVADATLASDGGGVVQVDTGEARAEIASAVELVLGRSGGAIVTTGAITLTAQQSPGATSAMRTAGGGVVRVGSNRASVDVRPVLTLTIAAGSTVTAGGAITITATFNATAPSAPVVDHVFQTIDA